MHFCIRKPRLKLKYEGRTQILEGAPPQGSQAKMQSELCVAMNNRNRNGNGCLLIGGLPGMLHGFQVIKMEHT